MSQQDLLEFIDLCERECRFLGFQPGEWVKHLGHPRLGKGEWTKCLLEPGVHTQVTVKLGLAVCPECTFGR
jgi:hypothetical protein